MKQDATYQYTGSNDYRRTVLVTVSDSLGTVPSSAYEEHDFPGVIRWAADNQCVPEYLCKAMGWRDMEAQRRAIDDFNDAMQQIMTLRGEL